MLSLKTIAWDNDKKCFVSPSHTEYSWKPGINWAICEKCAPKGEIQLDCTCGVYHSPNPEALTEYESYPTSIIALVKMYGVYDIWSGPLPDLPWTYPTRSDGIRVVGVLGSGSLKAAGFLEGTRGVTEVLALDKFQTTLLPWSLVRAMIQIRWLQHFQIDPYKDRRAK
jgi:hypothetical protein